MAKFSTTTTVEIHCPKCAGDRVVKIGFQRGQQRYRCKECRKDFRANGKATGRRMDAELMGAAIQDHYDGKSYKKIAEAVEKEYDIPEPSKATVYEWVRDFSAEAVEEMKDHSAKTGGGNWVADEMYLDVKGKKAYLWDIMDTDTRYILASHLSYNRDSTAARAMLRKALAASDGPPKSITTDKWRAYIKPIKDIVPEAKHIQSQGLAAEVNNNLSERLQGTYRDREKTLRGLESIETGQRFLDGWTLNYNLFRKHEGLKNKTPASKALVDPPFMEWADVVKGDAVEPQLVITAAPRLADAPKMELKELTQPKPMKSSRASSGGRTGTPSVLRMPKAKLRTPTASRKGRAKKLHPMAKLRNGIRRNQRKHGGGLR